MAFLRFREHCLQVGPLWAMSGCYALLPESNLKDAQVLSSCFCLTFSLMSSY